MENESFIENPMGIIEKNMVDDAISHGGLADHAIFGITYCKVSCKSHADRSLPSTLSIIQKKHFLQDFLSKLITSSFLRFPRLNSSKATKIFSGLTKSTYCIKNHDERRPAHTPKNI